MIKIFTTRTVLKKFPQEPSFQRGYAPTPFKIKGVSLAMTRRGYAVLELLFYIAFFAVLSLVVINAMILMTKSFRTTAVNIELMHGGTILERIVREIRGSNSINALSSNDLTLNTKDEFGADKTVRFLLSGNDVQFFENAVLTGNLNSPNLAVTALDFTQINTANGVAIKVLLTIQSDNDPLGKPFSFQDTIVLRDSYQ